MAVDKQQTGDSAGSKRPNVFELERKLLDEIAARRGDGDGDDVAGTRALIVADGEPETKAEPKAKAVPVAAKRRKSKYEITERIARGAESVLYLATDGENRYCVKAVRNLLGRMLGPSTMREQDAKLDVSYDAKVKHIKNEFEVGTKLAQPGDMPVVRIYSLGKISSCFIELGYDLLMEYIDGDDLGDRRALTMVSLADKISYFFQATQALRFMHLAGYIHLDMKPSNVMVSQGRVKLIDFGMTAPIGTKPRSIAGTAGYLSPEQLVREYADEGTDVFALGVTFGVIFGGSRLHQNHDQLQDKNVKMEARFHLEKSEAPMVTDVPDAQGVPELADLVRRCTIPRRDKRISNTITVINSLRRIAKDLDIRLPEPV